jgi:hypothetical protein
MHNPKFQVKKKPIINKPPNPICGWGLFNQLDEYPTT